MSVAAILQDTLSKVGIPVSGVSIGRKDNKGTWLVHYSGDPTLEQRAQVSDIISGFDVAAAEAKAAAAAGLARSDLNMPRIIEDIYDALISKGVIKKSDLPKSATDTIDARKTGRGKL